MMYKSLHTFASTKLHQRHSRSASISATPLTSKSAGQGIAKWRERLFSCHDAEYERLRLQVLVFYH